MINKHFLQTYSSELPLGSQIHVNHEGCSAGVDSKKRLYIKRVVGGVLGYCHHCRDHGFWRELSTDGTLLRKWLKGETTDHPVVYRESYLELGLYRAISVHSKGILDWLHKYYINPLTLDSDDLCFKQHCNSLYLPLRNSDSKEYGFQLRNFGVGPKYTTHYTSNVREEVSWFQYHAKKKSTLYITEDYTSAYRIWRDVGCDSLALLKTSISDHTLDLIRKFKYTDICIWLDPDAPGIAASNKLIARLNYALYVHSIQKTGPHVPEPKAFTAELLRRFCGL